MRMPGLVLLAPFSPVKSYSGGGLSRWIFEAGCCSDPQDPYSLPVAEHLSHVPGASCSQVPAVVPVLLSVAGPDPQYPEKWDLSSQCSPLHARISQRSHPSYSWCYPSAPGRTAPWSIPFHFVKVEDMTQAQEREMVHLDMVGEQDWAAGTGAAWWLDREVVELKRRN